LAKPSPHSSPATLLEYLYGQNPKKKNVLSILEKSTPAKIKRARDIFSFWGCRVKRGGGRAFVERTIQFKATTRSARGQSGLCSKKVRISTKRYRQFTISEFWRIFVSSRACGAVALRAKRAEFATICHAPRGEKETAWFWIWKFAEQSSDKMKFYYQSFFVSPKAKHGSDNFNILTASI